ncbi:hypothetical protein [Streptomyces sp. NPDC020607]|uniref:hypothetical protein n=1 Tax=Streptomyces sp. NPDC020607 TaxID=3365082 RepID=UPI0037B07C4A
MTEDTQRPTGDGTAPDDVTQYKIGSLIIDTARQRLGMVMGHLGGRLQLRAPSGGVEWDCGAEFARTPRSGEVETATVPGRRP